MAEIPLQSCNIRKLALDLTRNAAAADTMQTGKNKLLVVQNTSGATRQVTVGVPGTDFTGTNKPDLVESIANSEIAFIPVGDQYADSTLSGQASIAYDNVTGLKVAAVAFA